MAKKTYVNNLTDVMGAVDNNDKSYYTGLTEVQQKDLSKNMWLMMKYSSAVNNRFDLHYLVMTHELVNKDFARLNGHPVLAWKLMSLCGIGSKQYHYLPPPAGSIKKNKKHEILSELFPEYNADELELMLATNDREEIIDWCVCNGHDEKDIAKHF